ncbi:MAG TPA: AsmA family protein, partial [Firmicutes bacterium]|nr:AsmA family protein [Bacillota bacterium]
MASSGRALKVILIAVGAIAGVFLIALVLLAIFFPSDRVRAVIEEQAATYLERPLTIGDIGLSFWPLGVAVEDVVIGNDLALSDEPLVEVDRAVVSVRLWPLIARREVTIREISIQSPRIAYVIGEDGTTSVDGLLVEQPEPEPVKVTPSEVDTTAALAGIPFNLIVQEFSISNGSISFIDRQSDMDITVGSIDQTLRLDIVVAKNSLDVSGDFALGDITLMAAGQGIGPIELSGAYDALVDLGADSVSYVVDLRLAGVPMTSSGSVRTMSTTPDLTLLLQTGRIEIERLLAQLRLPPESQLARMEASGSVTLDAFVHTVIDSTLEEPPLDLDVSLTLDAIRMKHPDMPLAIDEIDGSVHVTSDTIMVGGFRLRAGGSGIDGEAMLVAWMTEEPFLKTAEISGKVILDEVASIVKLPDSTAVGGST